MRPESPDRSNASSEASVRQGLDEMMRTVEISCNADITVAMRLRMVDLVKLTKKRHYRMGTPVPVTGREILEFLDRVFHGGWTTRLTYFSPNHSSLAEIVLQTTTIVKVDPSLSKDALGGVELPDRVYILPRPVPPEIVTFDYVDINRKPVDVKVPDLVFQTKDYIRAMTEYDMRQFRTVGGYNRAWAVFFARARLVHWANGNDVATSPPGENLEDEIIKLRLCRDCDIGPFGRGGEALGEYKRTEEVPFDLRIIRDSPRSFDLRVIRGPPRSSDLHIVSDASRSVD